MGCNRVTKELVNWADLILVMEPSHSEFIFGHFRCDPDKVRVLDIPNRYVREDPELITELQRKITPILHMQDIL